MSYELEKHESGDKIKWILTLIAFILVGVMLTGVICGWFEKKEPEKEQEDVVPYSYVITAAVDACDCSYELVADVAVL